MLRRTMTVAMALALVLAAGTAFGQLDCVIGVYGDSGATVVDLTPERDLGTPANFDVYYAIYAEDFVNAVAWSRSFSGFADPTGFGLISLGFAYGPDPGSGSCAECVDVIGNPWGTFLDLQPEGYRLGLGVCKIGFGGVPVMLVRESLLLDLNAAGGTISTGANTLEDPDNPVYNTCINEIKPCNGASLTVQKPVSNDGKTFGSVKALYSN